MENKTPIEIASALVLLAAAVLLINPLHLWMPDMFHMSVLVALVAVAALLVAFVLREHPQDEREEMHRRYSGRAGFLAGAAVLIAAVAYEGFMGALDPWLVAALAAMLLAKVGAHLYSDRRL